MLLHELGLDAAAVVVVAAAGRTDAHLGLGMEGLGMWDHMAIAGEDWDQNPRLETFALQVGPEAVLQQLLGVPRSRDPLAVRTMAVQLVGLRTAGGERRAVLWL
jgi:hypothetical protein